MRLGRLLAVLLGLVLAVVGFVTMLSAGLALVDERRFGSGVVLLRYRVRS